MGDIDAPVIRVVSRLADYDAASGMLAPILQTHPIIRFSRTPF